MTDFHLIQQTAATSQGHGTSMVLPKRVNKGIFYSPSSKNSAQPSYYNVVDYGRDTARVGCASLCC